MAEKTLGVIGAGNMAEAILRGVIGSDLLAPEQIVVSEPLQERRDAICDLLGIECTAENAATACCSHVLLAVKPQILDGVLEQIAAEVHPEAVVISIAAGYRTAKIDSKLGGRGKIIRVMPNTPMLVGAGISALACGPRADTEDMQWARDLFAACGRTVLLDEEKMDAVTAVSGSGPAYVFYLAEAMIAAGIANGLGPQAASDLAIETVHGAAKLLQQTGEAPETLRKRVTSPNGTTEAAIGELDKRNVAADIVAAITAAARRSKDLGKA
ncbi:MAG: pyrroline-5-carboxylate reductase [Phycisphaerae bacterium]